MKTKTLEKFEVLNSEMLARVEGGGWNWGDFAKSGIAGGAGNGLRLGIKTITWQGVVAGAVGGAIIGKVGYGATCWW